jgi:hypothetical protein
MVFFLDKEKSWGLRTFALTSFWLVFTFVIRPKIFDGSFQNYGGGLIHGLLENPMGVLSKNLSLGSLRMLLDRAGPLLLLLSPMAIWNARSSFLRVAFITSPIFAVRMASNQWGFHYGTAAIISLLFLVIKTIPSKASPWRWRLSAGFLLITFLVQPLKTFLNPDKRCLNQSERVVEINKAQLWLSKSGLGDILLENNLASTQYFLSPSSQNIHLLCSPTGMATKIFDAILVEKPGSGDPWPCDYLTLEKKIAEWRESSQVKIVVDNAQVFLAVGKIRVEHPNPGL